MHPFLLSSAFQWMRNAFWYKKREEREDGDKGATTLKADAHTYAHLMLLRVFNSTRMNWIATTATALAQGIDTSQLPRCGKETKAHSSGRERGLPLTLCNCFTYYLRQSQQKRTHCERQSCIVPRTESTRFIKGKHMLKDWAYEPPTHIVLMVWLIPLPTYWY